MLYTRQTRHLGSLRGYGTEEDYGAIAGVKHSQVLFWEASTPSDALLLHRGSTAIMRGVSDLALLALSVRKRRGPWPPVTYG